MENMRYLALLVLALVVGCGPTIKEMAPAASTKGKLTLESKPFGDVAIILQPLGEGHPKTIQVAADGTFSCELVPGKYVYSIAKSSSKSAEQAIKKVDLKFLEPDMSRTVEIVPDQELLVAM